MRTALATAVLGLFGAACNGEIRTYEYQMGISSEQRAVLERAETTLAAAEDPGETVEEMEATLVSLEDLLRYLVIVDGRSAPGLFEDRVKQLITETEDAILGIQDAIDQLWVTQ